MLNIKDFALPHQWQLGSRRGLPPLLIMVGLASCVPGVAAERQQIAAASSPTRMAALIDQAGLPAPVMEPQALRQVPLEEAVAINAAIPIAAVPNPAAAAFRLTAGRPIDEMRSLDCLTEAIYYEAASESDDGQRAVAQVVLNRVRHPAYPASVCGVVYQGSERATGCQFTFTCDGSLMRVPSLTGWRRARRIAADALNGRVFAPVGLATHYHTRQVVPYWSATLLKSAVIGAHIFYRLGGRLGQAGAFHELYAGAEPLILPYKPLAQSAGATPAALAYAVPAVGEQHVPQLDTVLTVAGEAQTLVRPGDPGLPHSQIREAYRNSGKIRAQPLKATEIASSQ